MFNSEVFRMAFGLLLVVLLVVLSIRAIRDEYNLGKKFTWILWTAAFIVTTIVTFVELEKINDYEAFNLSNYIISCAVVYTILYFCMYLCKRAYFHVLQKKNV